MPWGVIAWHYQALLRPSWRKWVEGRHFAYVSMLHRADRDEAARQIWGPPCR